MPDLYDPTGTDDELLDRFQRTAFGYFLDHSNPLNGLVADRSVGDSPASIAVVGFALSCYPIGIERGWVPRARAVALTLAALRFLAQSRQATKDDPTGHKGFFYHFLDMATGQRAWRCEVSVMDTALLMAGILVTGRYFDGDDADEREIRERADALYRRVEWRWAQGRKIRLRQGWKPESGFIRHGWEGFSEAMILYILAAASRDHPVTADAYQVWSSTFERKTLLGEDVVYGGPLFMHQFSHAWIDFRSIRDDLMRDAGFDYFENSRRATLVHRGYARDNVRREAGDDENLWGLSAYDGPGRFTVRINGRAQKFLGYAPRGAPFGPDDGTISPWAGLASLPFAPEIAMQALRHLCRHYPDIVAGDRLPSAFNPRLAGWRDFGANGWVSTGRYGLDQGIIVMMIENFRSGLVWKLMRASPTIRAGLAKAGFTGGWLDWAA